MTVEQHQRSGPSEILTVKQGLVAGLGATLVMAAVAMAGSALGGVGVWAPINAAGSFFLGGGQPVPGEWAGVITVAGGIVTLCVGGLLGMLYASAQAPEDTFSLIVIGVFYGLVTYIVARLTLRVLNPDVFAVWRTWPVFISQLVYGGILASVAASRNPLRRRAVDRGRVGH